MVETHVPTSSDGPVTVIDVTKYPVTGGVNMIEAQNKKAFKIEKSLSFLQLHITLIHCFSKLLIVENLNSHPIFTSTDLILFWPRSRAFLIYIFLFFSRQSIWSKIGFSLLLDFPCYKNLGFSRSISYLYENWGLNFFILLTSFRYDRGHVTNSFRCISFILLKLFRIW